MNNIIKYDLKGQYKKFSILYIISLIASFACTFYIKTINPIEQSYALGFEILIIIIIIFSTTVFCIKDFSSEIYDDRSYLTFTLPISGQEFLCAKLINYLIWITITILVCCLIIFLNVKLITINKQIFNSKFLFDILRNIDYVVILIDLINLVFITMFFILSIYFYMILSKSININRKFSKFMSVILLIVFANLIAYADGKIGEMVNKKLLISSYGIKIINVSLNTFNSTIKYAYINIGSTLFNIVLFVLMFVLGSYLLNKKIDIK